MGFFFLFFFPFIFISWRLITLQYCSGFCHTLTWISHGFTCVPHPDPPSHFLPIPSLWLFPVHQPWALVSCIQQPRSMWDLGSPATDQTCTPCIGRQSLNHWPPGKPLHCMFDTLDPLFLLDLDENKKKVKIFVVLEIFCWFMHG